MIVWQRIGDAANQLRAWVGTSESKSDEDVRRDLRELCHRFWTLVAPTYFGSWNSLLGLVQIDEGQMALCGAVDLDLEQMLAGCSVTFLPARGFLQSEFSSMDEYVVQVRTERHRFVSLLVEEIHQFVTALPDDHPLKGRRVPFRVILSPEPDCEPLYAGDLTM